MKLVLDKHDEIFGPWISEKLGIKWHPESGVTIGLWDSVKGPVAATLYTNYNGRAVCASIAIAEKTLVNREFLWFIFYYPFEQVGVDKILSYVDSTNTKSVRIQKHLGFTLEATLKEAAPIGDLLIYSMTRDQCKWLSLKGRNCESTRSTAST